VDKIAKTRLECWLYMSLASFSILACADIGSDTAQLGDSVTPDISIDASNALDATRASDIEEPLDVGSPAADTAIQDSAISDVLDANATEDSALSDLGIVDAIDAGESTDQGALTDGFGTDVSDTDASVASDSTEADIVEPGPCDDDNICTDDYVDELTGECVNKYVYGICCTADPMCDDGDPCTEDRCVDELCAHTPSCCEADIDCGEPTACAQPTCLDTDPSQGLKKCALISTNAEGCCNTLMYFAGFDDGTLGGALVQNAFTEVGWQLTENTQANSPPGALWYGSALTGDYDNGTFNSGVVTFPALTLPAGVESLLDLDLYLDVEPGFSYDKLEIRLIDVDTGQTVVLWDKNQAFLYGGWFTVSLALQAFSGRTVSVSIFFDTFSAEENSGQGVFVDNVRISSSCNETVCATDLDCDDGHAFTIDECAVPEGQTTGACVYYQNSAFCLTYQECDDGEQCTINACINQQCYYAENPSCCLQDAECDDGNPCTVDDCLGVSETSGGTCKNLSIPGCCQSDFQCNDNDPCTVNTCDLATNTCGYTAIDGCCVTPDDCDDGIPCTDDLCVSNTCEFNNICCATDADCDDGESLCTIDTCDDGTCVSVFTDNSQCCTITKLFTQFTSGSWGPFTKAEDTDPSDGVGWFALPVGGISVGGVLKYGALGPGTYDTGFPHSGTVSTYVVQLSSSQVHEVSFWVKLDTEYANGTGSLLWDRLTLEAVREDNGEALLLWDSVWGEPQWWVESGGIPTGPVWTFVDALDVSSLKGQKIRLRFKFDTVDADANGYEGAFVDDVLLFSTCE
jgi:hypothetical protein